MILEGKTFCDGCGKEILRSEHYVNFKKPNSSGCSSFDYWAYHNRKRDDCWGKYIDSLNAEGPIR